MTAAAGGLAVDALAGERLRIGRISRYVALGGLLAGLYAVGVLLPFWYLKSPEAGAVFFPAAGLTLCMLFLTSRRLWPVWLAVIAVTEIAVDLTHGQTLGMASGFALANVAEPLVGASLLRRRVAGWRSFRELLLIYLVTAVVVGPAVGAVIGSSTSVLLGTNRAWASTAGRWWLGDALGVLVIATAILAWPTRSRFETRCSLWELGAITAAATAITIVPAVVWHHPLLYGALPVLIWGALRGGWRAVSVASVGMAFAADWATVTGRTNDLFAAGAPTEQLVFVQIFLAVTILAGLILAVEVTDRRRAEDVSRQAEVNQQRAELATELVAGEERRRIARETHDIVGHALTVMLLQAGAARRVLGSDPDLSVELLTSIENVGRDAFRDLDVALRITNGPDEGSVTRGLGDLPGLVELMRQTGMNIDLTVEGRGDVSRLVDWSGYRIIEEAVTNAAKHAPMARTTITVRFDEHSVFLSVVDDGGDPLDQAATPSEGTGRGLIGMRERIAVLGGQMYAGPRKGPGFVVMARLPNRWHT